MSAATGGLGREVADRDTDRGEHHLVAADGHDQFLERERRRDPRFEVELRGDELDEPA